MSIPASAHSSRRRRRHASLRKRHAKARRRAAKRTATALQGQRDAILAGRRPSPAGFGQAAKDLRALGKALRADAGRDRQVRAASRGLLRTAAGYELLAQAGRAKDAEQRGKAITKAVATFRDAEKLRKKAGDAWPF